MKMKYTIAISLPDLPATEKLLKHTIPYQLDRFLNLILTIYSNRFSYTIEKEIIDENLTRISE